MLEKILFVFSCLSTLCGVITLIITTILNKVMPKLGYVAYQAAAAGNYSESNYKMNFSSVNILAILLIVVGIIMSIRIYRSSIK